MSKTQRTREQGTKDQAAREQMPPRERIAAQQARQAHSARRRRMIAIIGVAAALLAVAGIVTGALVSSSGSKSTPSSSAGTLPAAVESSLKVPASTLAAVGIGDSGTQALKKISGPALTSDGKPELLYIGAEWCPYCAAERWALAVALSRFGTFSPLKGVHSSASDVYPNTATLTFSGSSYSSKYLTFTPVENQDVNHKLLQSPTSAQRALWAKYEPPGDGYPFIDLGNRYAATVTYNPQVLQGLTWTQIAADLHDPSSPVAKSINGSANLFTAAICKLTANKPANVCRTEPITTLAGQI